MHTVAKLQLSGWTHRQFYLPGEVVRVQVHVECIRSPDATKKDLYVPLEASSRHDYFSVDDAPETSRREADAHVATVQAAVGCHCRSNPAALSYDWGKVPLELSPSPAHGQRPPSGVVHDLGGPSETHELFSTRWWTVAEGVNLRSRQCRAYTFAFRLPESLPPTFFLRESAAWTELCIAAKWQPVTKTAKASEAAMQTRLVLPLLLYNPASVISHYCFTAQFPLAQEYPLARRDFEFTATPLPPVPSSSVSAPLDDSLYPGDSSAQGLGSSFQDCCVARQNELAEMREPLVMAIPVGCHPAALEVNLVSSIVSIGGCIRGSLVDRTSSAGGPGGDAAPVLVSAVGLLELLDCCPSPALSDKVPFSGVRGIDGVAQLHKFVTSAQEWILLDSPTTAFAFPLPAAEAQPTVLSDVGIALWQLRVKVQWTTAAHLARSREQGTGATLTMCVGGPEFVIPITVTPPRVPERPRRAGMRATAN